MCVLKRKFDPKSMLRDKGAAWKHECHKIMVKKWSKKSDLNLSSAEGFQYNHCALWVWPGVYGDCREIYLFVSYVYWNGNRIWKNFFINERLTLFTYRFLSSFKSIREGFGHTQLTLRLRFKPKLDKPKGNEPARLCWPVVYTAVVHKHESYSPTQF